VDPQLYLTQLLINLPTLPSSQLPQWLPDQWNIITPLDSTACNSPTRAPHNRWGSESAHDGLMPTLPQLLLHFLELRLNAVASRLPMKQELPLSRLATDEGEPDFGILIWPTLAV
jgi:hypothetical protein